MYIAIEGPIGVGKSSLTTKLASTFQWTALYEIIEENPFLSDFYEDINQWSFQTEMFFLCNRYKQISDIDTEHLISDYHIIKNKIFAHNTLHDKERAMFDKIYDVITEDMRAPDYTVILTADLEVLKQRIKLRNRTFEHHIEDEYLLNLISDYKKIAAEMPEDKTLFIDTSQIDFVNNEADYNGIVEKIKTLIGARHV